MRCSSAWRTVRSRQRSRRWPFASSHSSPRLVQRIACGNIPEAVLALFGELYIRFYLGPVDQTLPQTHGLVIVFQSFVYHRFTPKCHPASLIVRRVAGMAIHLRRRIGQIESLIKAPQRDIVAVGGISHSKAAFGDLGGHAEGVRPSREHPPYYDRRRLRGDGHPLSACTHCKSGGSTPPGYLRIRA